MGGCSLFARALSCAALAGGVVVVPVGGATAGADSFGRSFVAVGEASGGYIRYGIPGFFVVENFVDGGGPVSRASLGSDGTSQAFGSLPYPGSAGATYNGTVALATGSAPPAYPFYASAFNPTQPEQKVEDPSGAYKLSAVVTGERADGQAVMAAPPGEHPAFRAAAVSRSVLDGDEVRAEARSLTESLVVGPLSVGTVRSESVTRYEKDAAAPVTATAFQLDGGKAGDLTFSFGPGGFQVAKQGIPIPVPTGITALNQALAPAGLSVRFADPKVVPGGAAAAAFEVVQTAKVPGAGDGTFFIRLGGATSFIALGATEQDSAAEPHEGDGLSPTDTSAPPTAGPSAPAPTVGPAPLHETLGATPTSATAAVAERTASAGQPEAAFSVPEAAPATAPETLVATAPAGAGGRPEVALRTLSERALSASASQVSAVLMAAALAGCALVVGSWFVWRRAQWTA